MMKFKIPFTFANIDVQKRKKKFFLNWARKRKIFKKLEDYLKACDKGIKREEYISICLTNFFISLFIFSVLFSTILFFLHVGFFYVYGLSGGALFSIFLFFNQVNYPRSYVIKKERDIERNLIPALEDISIQLNSGVPMFSILRNIASADYGELSAEFEKAVREIDSGKPQIEVLDELAEKNTSDYFRRILWQISNGMRSGSDMSEVVKYGVDSLVEEQKIQIQSYGSRLNPLVMFYMLTAIILPILAIAFFTVISSMLNLASRTLKLSFVVIFLFVTFLQIMFLGAIKIRRPSLI